MMNETELLYLIVSIFLLIIDTLLLPKNDSRHR